MILVWILLSAVLLVENMIIPLQWYVFLWNSTTWALTFWAIIVWMMLWYWISWYMNSKDWDYEDSF